MNRATRALLGLGLGLVAACGPGQSTGGGSDTTDEGDGSTESGTQPTTETTDEADETDEGETETGEEPSECYGGESLDIGSWWGTVEPAVHDTEFWEFQTTHSMTCTVADVVEHAEDDRWEATLSCESDGVMLDLQWGVPDEFGLLDASWLMRSLSVVARGSYHPAGSSIEGWFVIRDEQGELVWISAGPSLPEAEWTEPLSIEVLDLGDDCTLVHDECYPEYANVVLFDSPMDGELRSYRGKGHQTENFTYLGESTTYEENLSNPECGEIFDGFFGRWDEVRVVRRP
jgi:hypothetical protein